MAMKRHEYYWEDFPAGSVREFGGITVSREDILRFAKEYDPQPFHVDEEAASRSPFGGLIASGWQTCGLAMRMACDAFLLESASVGSPGIENIRWVKPVRPGDKLRVRLTVKEARPLKTKPNVGLVLNHWQVLNQDGDEVMQMDGYGMFLRRDV
jgi:acyl dehydratase